MANIYRFLIALLLLPIVNLNAQDELPPRPRYEMDCFGRVRSATVTDKPDDPSVRSNLALIELLNTSDNYILDFEEIKPGETITTLWELTVERPWLDAVAHVRFIDMAGNDTTLTIEYIAPDLMVTPGNYDFGKITPGNPENHRFAITNERNEGIYIGKIELQKGGQGFSVELENNETLPYYLRKNDTLWATVTFDQTAMGTYKDSLFVWDFLPGGKQANCYHSAAFLRARIGDPIIRVEDADFSSVVVGSSISKTIKIYNDGEANLQLTGYTGPDTPDIFDAYLPDAGSFYKEIKPGEFYSFDVYFNPKEVKDYQDSIVFSSDAPTIDNVCLLNGEGVELEVTCTPEYDFGNCTVNRTAFPAGPYTLTQPFIITNDSPFDLTVEAISYGSMENLESFKFDKDKIIGMIIPANDSRTVDFEFNPLKVGPIELEVNIFLTNEVTISTNLKGVGILPVVETTDYNFDDVVANSGDSDYRTVRFTNLEGIYADELTIFGFDAVPPGSISDQAGAYGSEYFSYDKTKIMKNGVNPVNFPIKLQPGEFVEFEAEFKPGNSGNFSAILKSNSNSAIFNPTTGADYEERYEAESEWTGFSISDKYRFLDIIISNFTPSSCPNELIVFPIELYNSGDESLELDGNCYSISDVNNYFSIAMYQEIDITGPVTINPQESIKIFIEYLPQTAGLHNALFSVNTPSQAEKYQTITEEVYANSSTNIINSKALVSPEKVQRGEKFTYNLVFLPDEYFRYIKTDSVAISFSYSGESMEIDPATIRKASGMAAEWQIAGSPVITRAPDSFDRKVDLLLYSSEPKYLDSFDILIQAEFNTFLTAVTNSGQKPTYKDEFYISHTLNTFTPCTEAGTNEPAKIELESICVDSLRIIQVSQSDYGFAQIAPHPFSGTNLGLDFSIGFKAHTKLEIIDSYGNIVRVVVDKVLNEGNYHFDADVADLPSGVYILRLSSANYVFTQQLIILR